MVIECKHWDAGVCSLGLFKGRPEAYICLYACHDYDGPPRGLGDRVANGIKRATGGRITPCGGCKGRQAALNRMMPARNP